MTDDVPIQYRHFILSSAIQYVDASPDEPCVALHVNTHNSHKLTRYEQLVGVNNHTTKAPRIVHHIVPQSDLHWAKQELEDVHRGTVSEIGKTRAFGSTIGVVSLGTDLKDKMLNMQRHMGQDDYFDDFVSGYLDTREGYVEVYDKRTVKEPFLTANNFLHRASLGYASLKNDYKDQFLTDNYVRRGLKQKYMDNMFSVLKPMHRADRRSIYAQYLLTDPCQKEKDVQRTFEKLRGPAGNFLDVLRQGLHKPC